MLAAPYHHWVQENAPENNKFTHIALGKAIGSDLIGASASFIGLGLYKNLEWFEAPGLYLSLLCIVSFLCIRKKAPLLSTN